MREYYRHVKHPYKPDQYVGTVCVLQGEGGDYQASFSQCNPVDQFSKHKGRAIARARAEQGYQPKEVGLKSWNEDGSRFKLFPVTNALVDMVLDAEASQLYKGCEL